MKDKFLQLARPPRRSLYGGPDTEASQDGPASYSKSHGVDAGHSKRKHSRFSASGAERWFRCPGSVALSEGLPDKFSKWAEEGTRAHEILERLLLDAINVRGFKVNPYDPMYIYGKPAADFILKFWRDSADSEILVETRIHLDFIHSEMFGTFDGAVIDHFGTLHVFDYKYGAGHAVSPKENLQMIFYGLGLAHLYDWNFKNVRLWIIQPRIKNYQGPLWWELSMQELHKYVDSFREAVRRVESSPDSYVEGMHCYWCRAKYICPLKQEKRIEKARSIFANLATIS